MTNVGALQSIVSRIESLEADKAATVADIKVVYAEAEREGLKPKTIRAVVKARRVSKAERQAQEAEVEAYLSALGE